MALKVPLSGSSPFRLLGLLSFLGLIGFTYIIWWPPLSAWVDTVILSSRPDSDLGDQHDHLGISEIASENKYIKLTRQARLNLGLTDDFLKPVELGSYRRSITIPAVVAPKPGRSQIIVSSPLNGVVTHVHAVTGEAVKPGELLFEIRLTYEDLVESQTQYLQTISELQVESREIARLEQATQSGAISGKALLDRRYAQEKLAALLKSQREALRLHGLSERQIDSIGNDGKLLSELKIVAPDIDRHQDDEELRLSQVAFQSVAFVKTNKQQSDVSESQPLVIDQLFIHKGQAVTAGETLCSLSDYAQLFIVGKAFEQDVLAISGALQRGWGVDAVFPSSGGNKVIEGLKLAYVDNSIDPVSRTLSFYVELPNEVVRDEINAYAQRFIAWQHRVGQRLEVRVPVEQWDNQLVLPVEAVIKEGPDWYVFQQNGNRFERIAVHVRHRDQTSVVVANDGSIYAGDVIAMRSAHQLQMAVTNQSGTPVDPHAGHNH